MNDLGPCKDPSEWLQMGQGVLNLIQVLMLAWLARRAVNKDSVDHWRWQQNFSEQAKVRQELRDGPTVDHDSRR